MCVYFCLSFHQYYIALITVAIQQTLTWVRLVQPLYSLSRLYQLFQTCDFPYKLYNKLTCLPKILRKILINISLNLYINLRNIDLITVISLNPQAQYDSPFIQVFFDFYHLHFIIFIVRMSILYMVWEVFTLE